MSRFPKLRCVSRKVPIIRLPKQWTHRLFKNIENINRIQPWKIILQQMAKHSKFLLYNGKNVIEAPPIHAPLMGKRTKGFKNSIEKSG